MHTGSVELQVSALASLLSFNKPTKSSEDSRGIFLTMKRQRVYRALSMDHRVLELEENLEAETIAVLSQTRNIIRLSDFYSRTAGKWLHWNPNSCLLFSSILSPILGGFPKSMLGYLSEFYYNNKSCWNMLITKHVKLSGRMPRLNKWGMQIWQAWDESVPFG